MFISVTLATPRHFFYILVLSTWKSITTVCTYAIPSTPRNYTAARLIVADIDYNSNSSKCNFQYSPGYAEISDTKLLKLSSYKPIAIGKNDAHRGVRRQFDFKYYHLSSAIKNCVQILRISAWREFSLSHVTALEMVWRRFIQCNCSYDTEAVCKNML